jgi:hypothetical protein
LRNLIFISFFILASSVQSFGFAQDTTRINKKRLIAVVAGVNGTYAASMIYLSHTWYNNQTQTSFHFFNDNREWLQMDKIGHATTSFHESEFLIQAYQWSGVSRKKAIIYGGIGGFLYQTPIEILDGFSTEYGASYGDVIANASGSALVIGQYLLWDEIRIQPKFSFHQSGLAHQRPNVLGSTIGEQILKDYNGQTYWLSFNLSSFIKKENKFPKWLNIAVGYGAQGMIYSRKEENVLNGYSLPYRQYYLSFDIDMRHVKTKKKWLKYCLYPLNFIHIPFPSLQFDKKGVHFYPLYF